MALRAIVLITCLALAQAELINLSCQHIRAFVDGHNQRRLQVARGELPGQPPAQDMSYMVWDEELAAKAAAWAAKNIYNHNPDKYIGSGRFETRENVNMIRKYEQVNTDLVIEEAIQSWFIEHKDYTFGPMTGRDPRIPPMTGHYTQVVWAEYAYIGCAISQYWQNNINHFLVFCNYGPADDFRVGRTPYVQGGPITQLTCTGDCRQPYGKQCLRRWPFLF